MKLLYVCPTCKGTGGDGNPDTTVSCASCNGVGEIEANMRVPDLDDLKDRVEDIMNKCNDIFEEVNV